MKPVVFVIDGRMGSGKTEFTKAWLGKSDKALFNAGPERVGDPLAMGDAFAEHDMVGLDEIGQFEPVSAKAAIDRLITDAKASHKQLVLVVQELSQLAAIGIELPDETAYATFRAAPVSQAKFRFKGQELIVS